MKAKRSCAVVLLVAIVVIATCAIMAQKAIQGWRRQFFTDQAMWSAIENNNIPAAEMALNRGAEVNEQGDAGLGERHVLITAQAHDDPAMVNMLLKHGADPALALTLALNTGEAIKLLSIGAKVNATTQTDGMTPLGTQAADGRPEIVKLLLLRGADPSLKDKDGLTAQQRAEYAAEKHPEEKSQYSVIFNLLKHAEAHKLMGT